MLIYVIQDEIYFDTFAGDEIVPIVRGYYATRGLAEKALKEKFHGFGEVIEVIVEKED